MESAVRGEIVKSLNQADVIDGKDLQRLKREMKALFQMVHPEYRLETESLLRNAPRLLGAETGKSEEIEDLLAKGLAWGFFYGIRQGLEFSRSLRKNREHKATSTAALIVRAYEQNPKLSRQKIIEFLELHDVPVTSELGIESAAIEALGKKRPIGWRDVITVRKANVALGVYLQRLRNEAINSVQARDWAKIFANLDESPRPQVRKNRSPKAPDKNGPG
jgi:hypothetical protein